VGTPSRSLSGQAALSTAEGLGQVIGLLRAHWDRGQWGHVQEHR
jgi:hypothetical protein